MLTGNREFNEIYEKYKNLVMKAAYIYSGSYEAAEDIAQDTFLKLYIGFDHFRKDNIPSWLYTTAKNTALNYKKKAGKEVLDGGDPEKESSEEPSEKVLKMSILNIYLLTRRKNFMNVLSLLLWRRIQGGMKP